MQGVLALGCYTSQVRRRCRLGGGRSVGGVGSGRAVLGCGDCDDGDDDDGELAVLLLAQESGRVLVPHAKFRIVPRKGERARRGSGWPGCRWWAAVERAVGE